jgi:hypothetical protein
MQQGVGTIERALRAVGGHGGWLAGLLLIAGWLALPSIGLAAEGATTGPTEYRDIPYIGSRNLIWIVAQLHLLLAGSADLCLVVLGRRVERRRKAL